MPFNKQQELVFLSQHKLEMSNLTDYTLYGRLIFDIAKLTPDH